MSDASPECRVFGAAPLLPEAWQQLTAEGPVRTFNPALLREGAGWIFAYRIAGMDGRRRIGLCRLTAQFEVVAGSPVPLTDHVRFRPDGVYPEIGTQWFADPRLYRFGGRIFVYWNSGWHEPRNCQFIQELDPQTLLPRGHPREMLLRGERRKLEKNWTFFEAPSGRLHAVYSILPHRILEFSLAGDGDVAFEDCAQTEWALENYPPHHGGLRGGAPPVLADGAFWTFCHSVHDSPAGYRYAAAAYAFTSTAPFAPVSAPRTVLTLGNPFGETRTYERLNPAVGEVIYPCGAARDGARWIVSHGINDEYCAISLVSHADVLATQQPLVRT